MVASETDSGSTGTLISMAMARDSFGMACGMEMDAGWVDGSVVGVGADRADQRVFDEGILFGHVRVVVAAGRRR